MKHKISIIIITLFTTISLTTSTILYWSTLHPLLRFLMIDAIAASAICLAGFITTTIQDYKLNKLWKEFCDENKRRDKENRPC